MKAGARFAPRVGSAALVGSKRGDDQLFEQSAVWGETHEIELREWSLIVRRKIGRGPKKWQKRVDRRCLRIVRG
jgi:hypothetical protein